MHVLVLGATGVIGSAITDELLAHKYTVTGLARSDTSAQSLTAKGANVLRGDIIAPEKWQHAIHDVDAIIHVAITFGDDMGDVDRRLIEALIDEGAKRDRKVRLIYTGGTWLYGVTGDSVATEETPFDSIAPFTWMLDNIQTIMDADSLDGIVIHPAMVYTRDGGVLSRFLDSAKETGRVDVWGSLETRWPVVHQKDIASAYRLALENGKPGEHYNISAEDGVPVADMVEAISQRLGVTTEPNIRTVAELVAEQGAWAEGPTLDQQMGSEKARRDLGWQPTVPDILSEIR